MRGNPSIVLRVNEQFVGCSGWDCHVPPKPRIAGRRGISFHALTVLGLKHSITMPYPEPSGEGSSLWLSHPVTLRYTQCEAFTSIQESFSRFFNLETPDPPVGGRSAYAESPAFCCLDFPGGTVWYPPRIRIPMYAVIIA